MLTHRNFFAEGGDDIKALPEAAWHPGQPRCCCSCRWRTSSPALVAVRRREARVTLGHTADIKNLVADLADLPADVDPRRAARVREGLQHGAQRKAAADGKGKIFDAAADAAIAYSRALGLRRPGLRPAAQARVFDKLVYTKLRAVLGGRVRATRCPAAPRWASGWRTSSAASASPVFEGYGLTETTAAATFNPGTPARSARSAGRCRVGGRIADDGEVLLHGATLFSGYWNNDGATAEALADGWFHTGDLGELDEDGYLAITGRKKEIIVTAGGKNVAPSALEDRSGPTRWSRVHGGR